VSARNIIRELQALGARLERDGDRLILRAGSRLIPQLVVQQARDAKQELIALLDETAALSVPRREGPFPATKNPVASSEENCPESRRNSRGSLRMPVGTLSGILSGGPAAMASLDGDGSPAKSEDPCAPGEYCHVSTSGRQADFAKDATLKTPLASLAKSHGFCGSAPPLGPKDATAFCREYLSHDAAQQNAARQEGRETVGCATQGYHAEAGRSSATSRGEVEKARAAIVERDAGIPREWADRLARLHPDRPPGNAPPNRWRQFIGDCGRLLGAGLIGCPTRNLIGTEGPYRNCTPF
jgi:hypothetical protein